jgi:hypothetical protein
VTADPLQQVLELVAEGRLSAEEAAPILDALDDMSPGGGTTRPGGRPPGREPWSATAAGFAAGLGAPPSAEPPAGGQGPAGHGAGPDYLRLEVREGGRQVVNVRLPIAVGRLALGRVPGLSGDQVDRVREALRTGMRGPLLEVHDGDNDVWIVLE